MNLPQRSSNSLHRWIKALYSLPVLLTASPVAAAGGGGGGIGWGFMFKVVNFAAFFYILYVVIKRRLPGHLAERQATVGEALERARTAEEKAKALLDEYEGRLNGLNQEIEQLLQEARTRAERDRHQMIEAAKQEASQILEAAEISARRLEERIAVQARQLLADEVMGEVEQRLKQQLTKNAKATQTLQDQMMKQLVQEVAHREGV